jgi:thiol-disulfide isomerase/thioredoxin
MEMRSSFFALLAAFAFADPNQNWAKVKWGQDNDKIFLFVRMKCVEGRSLNFSPEGINFSCSKAKTGTMMVDSLQFTTHSDIVPESCFCKSNRNGEECVLLKRNSHVWPSLSQDPNELKGIAKVDWDNWLEVGDEPQNPYKGFAEVTKMSGPEIEEALSFSKGGASMVVADFWYRWCDKCADEQKALIKVAQEYSKGKASDESKKDVQFVRLDTAKYRLLGRQYNVTCPAEKKVHKRWFCILGIFIPAALSGLQLLCVQEK